jgi:phage baseplate assembly protein W
MMDVTDRPHFAFPFQRGENGSVNVVEQSTPEHVAACENVIVRCPTGFREARPEFGWPFPEFATVPISLEPLRAALRLFEPRGEADVQEYADAASASIRHISIEVRS